MKSVVISQSNASPASDYRSHFAFIVVIGTVLALTLAVSFAGEQKEADTNPLKGVKLEAVAYIDYSNGQTALPNGEKEDYNRFRITRGYFTFKKDVKSWMSIRYTIDTHQDDSGDYKRRDKYLYVELRPGDAGFLTHMKSEIGMGHMPWLDFEEHINPYRCQGTMAIERAGTFNSADVGVSLRGYLGEEMEDAKGKTGNKNYAGRYGSWHLGVYNGGGYHAAEHNENKVLEGRLTLRPLADAAPGLQLSYLGIYGKGNVASAGCLPKYQVNLGMLSYEHPDLVLTAQLFAARGNQKGVWTDPATGKSLETMGYSAFAKLGIPGTDGRWRLFGRYDHFDADADDVIADETAYDMIMCGIAYSLYQDNLVMLVFESTDFETHSQGKGKVPTAVFFNPDTEEHLGNLGKDQKIQLVYQIKL